MHIVSRHAAACKEHPNASMTLRRLTGIHSNKLRHLVCFEAHRMWREMLDWTHTWVCKTRTLGEDKLRSCRSNVTWWVLYR